MASKSPQKPEALVADFDLWVVPQAAHSQWFARLDWYLNWQMSKGLAHQRGKPSVELLRVLEETGIKPITDPHTHATPLMVASLGRLNAEKCVLINFNKELSPWLKKIHELSEGLKIKHMRVFLPHGIGEKEASAAWQKISDLDIKVEFSPDEATT